MLNRDSLSDPQPTRLLTTVEAAELLRTTAHSLQVARCLRRDTPRYVKCGRRVLYRLSDVETWLSAHEVDPAGAERAR